MSKKQYKPGIYVVRRDRKYVMVTLADNGVWWEFGVTYIKPPGKIIAGPFTPEQIAGMSKAVNEQTKCSLRLAERVEDLLGTIKEAHGWICAKCPDDARRILRADLVAAKKVHRSRKDQK